VEAFPRRRPISLIDVGASIGEFTEGIRKQFGLRRALLVEPQPDRCEVLRKRFATPVVTVADCALSEHSGDSELEVLNFDFSSSLLPLLRGDSTLTGGLDLGLRERIRCRTLTLDDLLAEVAWKEPIDLLKLDVQGAELMALRGASISLGYVHRAWVEVSFRPLYEGSCVFAEIYEFMRERGFRMLSLEGGFKGTDGELLQGDALFSR
jgi:FkbM family methyltransferase